MATREKGWIPWWRLGRSLAASIAVVVLLGMLKPEYSAAALFANGLTFALFLYLSTAAHELGHAGAAGLLGVRTWRVYIGTGPVLLRGRLARGEWLIGSIPFAGSTLVEPRPDGWVKLRHWWIVLAGPGVNAAIALAAAQAVEQERFAVAFVPARMLEVANVFLLLSSLIPLRIAGACQTDGWQLLRTPFLTDEELAESRVLRELYESEEARERGEPEAALSACERGLAEHPKSVILANSKAIALLDLGRSVEARDILRELAQREPLPTQQLRLLLQNNLAWANLQGDDDSLAVEADELSSRVIRHMPRAGFAAGTRGAALVRLGRPSEAAALLERAFETNPDQRNRAHNAAWLAIAQAKLGRIDQARRWLEIAESLDARSYSLPRARAAVGALCAQGQVDGSIPNTKETGSAAP